MRKDPISWGGLALGGVLILAAGYLFLKERRANPTPAPLSVPHTDQRHPLVKEQGASVLYKLDQANQDTLLAAVEQFCVKSYERDTCIHHFTTCGHPCLVVIPADKRKKILEDYKALRKSRGLPDVPPLPKDD